MHDTITGPVFQEMLIFGAAALVIGLLVRKPFIGTNHFVSEKLEETELM